ncbi:TPA: hypothetical protein O6I79_001073 [Staphylococcus aureus]|nr:hypothetical protein [Staphylococcus aureus]
MKKLVSIVGATLLLAGCGSQNLAPLEEKTTDLREDNHQLKLDIQELNQQISDSKSKIKGLEKDKENSKKTAFNNTKIKLMNVTSTYYDKVAKALKSYNDIEKDVSKNKGDKNVQSKLNQISNDIQSAHTSYKDAIDGLSLSDDDKKTSKNIDKLNSDLNHAFDDIKNGYQNKDKKQLTKGQQALSKLNLNAKS